MPSRLSAFLAELKRRRVFRVTAFSAFLTELKRRRAWDPLREHPRFQVLVAKYGGG